MNTEILKEFREWENNEAIQTLKECGITEGMTVMDFGCGVPHYSVPASTIVGADGKVYAIDKNKFIIDLVKKRVKDENLNNVIPIQLDESKLNDFSESVDFIMLYDLVGLLEENDANRQTLTNFNNILKDNGVFSFAIYNEVMLVNDPVNGPFTQRGKPSWFRIPYEEALERKNIFPFVESCGFKLKNVVENGGVHFDEIDFKLDKKTFLNKRLSDLERRNIYNYVKV